MAAAGDKLDTKRICVSGGSVPRYRKQRNFLISRKSVVGTQGFNHMPLVQMATGRRASWRGKVLHDAFTGQLEASRVDLGDERH